MNPWSARRVGPFHFSNVVESSRDFIQSTIIQHRNQAIHSQYRMEFDWTGCATGGRLGVHPPLDQGDRNGPFRDFVDWLDVDWLL